MNSLLITRNLIKRMIKEKSSFLFLALLPVVAGIFVTVIAPNSGPEVAHIGFEQGALAHPVFQTLAESPLYNVELLSKQQLLAAVEAGTFQAGVVLPDDGGRIQLIAKEESGEVQMLSGTINAIMAAVQNGGPLPVIELPPDTGAYDRPRMAMGFLTLFMLMFIGSGVGLLLEDKKGKTFMRTFCAPVKGYEVVLGNLAANLLLGVMQITLFLLVSQYVLKIDWGIPLINVFVLLVAFLVTAIGLGIGLAGFVQDSEKFNVLLTLVAMPTSLLGGGFFPMEMLPEALRKVATFIPQTWVMEAFSKMHLEGVGLRGVSTHLLIIMLFGAVLFTFGVKTLRPTTSDL